MAKTAVLPATIYVPTHAEDERYAGLVLGDGVWYHLILLPAKAPPEGWEQQMGWAKEQGGYLPTRPEQAVLYANLPDEFEGYWYWSNTPYAGDDAYVWCQYFSHGSQGYDHKSAKLRARAVRRVAITKADHA